MTDPLTLANRVALIAVFDALTVQQKIRVEQRLLHLLRSTIPGVEPRTTAATEVRSEIDSLVRVLQRSLAE